MIEITTLLDVPLVQEGIGAAALFLIGVGLLLLAEPGLPDGLAGRRAEIERQLRHPPRSR